MTWLRWIACVLILVGLSACSSPPEPVPAAAATSAAPSSPPTAGDTLATIESARLEVGRACTSSIQKVSKADKVSHAIAQTSVLVDAVRLSSQPRTWECPWQPLVRKARAEEAKRARAEAARREKEEGARVASKDKASPPNKSRAKRPPRRTTRAEKARTKKPGKNTREAKRRDKKKAKSGPTKRGKRRINPKGAAALSFKGSEVLRARVNNDLANWDKVFRLYKKRNICEPPDFVLEGIAEFDFLGYRVEVDTRLLPRLWRVVQLYAERGYARPAFDYAKGFTARTVRGPFGEKNVLSNHGLGLAMDFDPAKNPFYSPRELAFIEKIAGMKLKRGRELSAGERWDSFKAVSEAFEAKFDEWRKGLGAELREANRQGRRGRGRVKRLQKELAFAERKNLAAARKGGLTTLPREFVVVMEEVGLRWGTWWSSGADLMHFSYDPRAVEEDDDQGEGLSP